MRGLHAALVLLVLAAPPALRAAADPTQPLAPRMEFVPPPAGSYRLQRIERAPEARLIDASARPTPLSSVTRGKITLLSFFYTYCTNALGCPFAYRTLMELRERLLADVSLARRVRFVNISFDPTNDTPEALRLYGGKLLDDPRFEWRLLSAHSVRALLPLLDAFGQDVDVVTDAKGRPTRVRNHMLKMFLLDDEGVVREIYTLEFLIPPVLLNDIRTLAMESGMR